MSSECHSDFCASSFIVLSSSPFPGQQALRDAGPHRPGPGPSHSSLSSSSSALLSTSQFVCSARFSIGNLACAHLGVRLRRMACRAPVPHGTSMLLAWVCSVSMLLAWAPAPTSVSTFLRHVACEGRQEITQPQPRPPWAALACLVHGASRWFEDKAFVILGWGDAGLGLKVHGSMRGPRGLQGGHQGHPTEAPRLMDLAEGRHGGAGRARSRE